MDRARIARSLKRNIAWGVYAALCTPLVVSVSSIFPYVVGKTIAFRLIVETMFPLWVAWILLAQRCTASWTYLRSHCLSVAVLLYFAAVTLSTTFSVVPYRSFWSNAERMEGLLSLAHFLLFFCILASVFRGDRPHWLRFFRWSVWVSVLITLAGYLQWLRLPFLILSRERVESTLGNSSYFAVYLLFHIALSTLLAFETSRIPSRILYGVIAGGQAVMLFLTGTRGVFIGIGVTAASFAIMVLWVRALRPLRPVALGVLVVFVAASVSLWVFRERELVRTTPALARAASLFRPMDEKSVRRRLVNWRITLDAWRARPVFGWGPEMYSAVFYTYLDTTAASVEESIFDRPHNKLLELLSLTGVVGLLTYLGIFAVSAVYLARVWAPQTLDQRSSEDEHHRVGLPYVGREALLFGGLLSVYFIQNLFLFDHHASYLLFFLILGYLEASSPERSPASSSATREASQPSPLPMTVARPRRLFVRLGSASVVLGAVVLGAIGISVNLSHFDYCQRLNKLSDTSLEASLSVFKSLVRENSPFLVDSVTRFHRVMTQKSAPKSVVADSLKVAIWAARQAWKQDPYEVKVPSALASSLVARYQLQKDPADLQEAKAALLRARELAPRFPQILYQLAAVARVEGRDEDAQEYVEKALAVSSSAKEGRRAPSGGTPSGAPELESR